LFIGHGLRIFVLFLHGAMGPFGENGNEISGSTKNDEFICQSDDYYLFQE
jgi:hypothetical protein